MKSIFAALMVALLVAGCDRGNPIDSSASTSTAQPEAMFSELSMIKTTQATSIVEIITADSGRHLHDSLRNARMLDSLKAHLSLTDTQFESLKSAGSTLFTTLADIRTQVMAQTITRDAAKDLVVAARDQFVVSVKSILTADQLTLFETWLAKYWNNPPHRGGPGGPGGRRGHGGPGGPGAPNDSLRTVQMLDSLKAYLSLTDTQYESLKSFGAALNVTMGEIKVKVEAHAITPDSAQTLVKAARDLFVTSVKSILTADQSTLFDTWLGRFWNNPPPPHHGGRGGHGGPGGPGH